MSIAVADRVRGLAANIFQMDLAQIGPESSPDTVPAWDSLQHLNLVVALEQEFDIQFTPEEIEQMLSVDLIAALLAEKLQTSRVA